MTARKHSPEPDRVSLTKSRTAQGSTSGDARGGPDSQDRYGVTDLSPESIVNSTARNRSAQGSPSVPPNGVPPATHRTAAPDFTDLRIWAESFADAQQTRIALVNRMERGGIDADLLAGHRQLLDASEHAFKLAMVRSYRHTVRQSMPAVEEWQKANFGIGEHLLARLLGHLGHPVLAEPYAWMDEAPEGHTCIPERCGQRHLVALEPFERSLRQLWAYCGVGAPERRRKGMTQQDALSLGKPRLKMLLRLLAEATIKCRPEPVLCATAKKDTAQAEQSTPPEADSTAIERPAGTGPSPIEEANAVHASARDQYYYRRIYDARKASTEDRGWTDGHRHADALRIVSKEILRDLWTAAQGTHGGHAYHGTFGGPS